jgi:hypothetical protein
MKNFSQFIIETKQSLAVFNAKRLGLVGDGHGGWHGRKTGEFIAKTKDGNLEFYNQNQRIGQQDPAQIKPLTAKDQKNIASKQKPNIPTKTESYEKTLREKYISGKIFNVGEWVENVNSGLVGKIIRRGTNYLICVTEDDVMFKPWIKDVVEWTNRSGVPANQREVGTDSLRKYVMSMTGTTDIKNFINKYKAKSK